MFTGEISRILHGICCTSMFSIIVNYGYVPQSVAVFRDGRPAQKTANVSYHLTSSPSPIAIASAAPSPSPTPSPYPMPTTTALSVNTYVFIVSDNEEIITKARRQASEVGNLTSSPSPSSSPSATLAGASPNPNAKIAALSKKSSVLSVKSLSAIDAISSAPSADLPKRIREAHAQALSLKQASVELATETSQLAAKASPKPTEAPSAEPSPGDGNSDVSGSILKSITALNSDIQSDLVEQFKRRDIPVVNKTQFDDLCNNNPAANVVALHWSIIDPTIQVDNSWDLFGYTSSKLEIYWHLVACNSRQEILLNNSGQDNTIYHSSSGKNFQLRSPTDFLASLFSALSLVHPAGRALVSIGVTGGISGVSGALNSLLNASYGKHDLVESTERRVAWEVANEYCSGNTAIKCHRVSKN